MEGDNPTVLECTYVYNPYNQKLIGVIENYSITGEWNYDYPGDYEKIIESAVMIKSESDKKKSGKVDPDFKAAMDSYENFFDSYVKFMKRYSKSEDPVGMLSDYLDYMNQYVDTMEKLSAEDYKYYVDVTARITKKLLEVSESLSE